MITIDIFAPLKSYPILALLSLIALTNIAEACDAHMGEACTRSNGALCTTNGVIGCDGACNAAVPPKNTGGCANGYSGPNLVACVREGKKDCDVGLCRVCVNGVVCRASDPLIPTPASLGSAESCNGVDDDCDGTADDGACGSCAAGFYDDATTQAARARRFIVQEIKP